MRLTQQQWFLVARAVNFVAGMARDKRARPILKLFGRDGLKAAREGVRPSREITAKGDHEAIGVDEKALEEFIRLQEEDGNLKAVLMELGNRLVRKHRFKFAKAVFDPERDSAFLKSTQMIAMFVAWLNHVPEARQILAERGLSWPLGQFQGPARDGRVAVE